MKNSKTVFFLFSFLIIVNIALSENRINIRLMGTIISNNNSYCLLKDNNSGKFEFLKQGKILNNNLKIIKIMRKHIVLHDFTRNKDYLVYMGSDFNMNFKKRIDIRQTRNNYPSKPINEKEKRFFIKNKILKKYLNNPTEILYSASAIPVYNNKSMTGYKIKNIKKGSMIERFGIRNGDIILQVNGIPTTDTSSLFSLYNRINSIKQFTILIKRNGSIMTLYYNIGN
jgi:general secretion pathway protein C